MAFLNPSVLYALPAVALPLLIHLFARQRARIIPFSSLRFLKELQQTEIRRLRLREWLLLLLRTLAVALAVLAFARPAVVPPGGNPEAVGSRVAAAIVLDDSYSMQVATPRGSLFQEACDRVRDILSALTPSDVAVVIRPRGSVRESQVFPIQNWWQGNAGAKEERWAEEPRGVYDTDWLGGTKTAAEWFRHFPGARHELYLVSDFAGPGFAVHDTSFFRSMARCQVFLAPVSARDITNATVEKARLEDQILEPGTAVEVLSAVANTGTEALDERLVQLSWQNRPVDQTTVSLEPGVSRFVRLRFIPLVPGWQFGAVSVEDDALAVDNTFWFAVQVPEKLKVLVVAGSPEEAKPVAVALSPPGTKRRIYTVTVKRPTRVVTSDLKDVDTVFLIDVGALPSLGWSALVRFVRQGGTLVVFPGPRVEPRVLTQQLLDPLGLPPLGETLGTPGSAVPVLTLGRVDFSHPLFRGVFEKRARISSPAFYVVLRSVPSASVRPVLSYSNGAPLLYEATVDAGEVFVFTTGLHQSWSDLPRKGLFVPLIVRLPVYGRSKGQGAKLAAKTGQKLKLVDRRLSLRGQYLIQRPDGMRVKVVPRATGEGVFFEYDDTDLPGVYTLLAGDAVVHMWAVNPDPAESDLRPVDLKALAHRLQGYVLGEGVNIADAVKKARDGRELWPFLSALLFSVLLLETVLARTRPVEEQTGGS